MLVQVAFVGSKSKFTKSFHCKIAIYERNGFFYLMLINDLLFKLMHEIVSCVVLISTVQTGIKFFSV